MQADEKGSTQYTSYRFFLYNNRWSPSMATASPFWLRRRVTLQSCSYKYSRAGVSILLCILAIFITGISHANVLPVTATHHFTIDDLPTDAIAIAGLTDNETADKPNVLAVYWEPVQTGFFPTWQLTLQSDIGLIPEQTALRLTQVTPEPNTSYTAKLSYDPTTGALAFGLFDADEKPVITQGWHIDEYDGRLSVASLPHVHSATSQPWYEPFDLQWHMGTMQEERFISLKTIEPGIHNTVRIQVSAPLSGTFQLMNQDGTIVPLTPLNDNHDENLLFTFSANDLQLGEQTITLQYKEQNNIRFAKEQTIHVGRVQAEMSPVRYDRDREEFAFDLKLESAGTLDALHFAGEVMVERMVWHDAQRTYHYETVATHALHIAPSEETTSSRAVRLAVPAPQEENAWRLRVSLHATPDVNIRFSDATAYIATYEPVAIESEEPFTVAILPDTQYYAETYHEIYMRQAQWLSAQAKKENIAFVLHVGDITEDNVPNQWRIARQAHNIMDGVVPYVLAAGNHDYAQSGLIADRSTTLINDFFSAGDMPHLAGTMKENRLENAYYTFTMQNNDFLVLSLEFAPSDEALQWAHTIVQQHPYHRVIVLTHGYLYPSRNRMPTGASAAVFPMGENPDTTMNDGADVWTQFVSHYENIFMVVSGHIHSDALPHTISIGRNGNRVHEILANYQAGENGGNGFLVLLQFTPDNKIHGSVYSPYLDEIKTGRDAHSNPTHFTTTWP